MCSSDLEDERAELEELKPSNEAPEERRDRDETPEADDPDAPARPLLTPMNRAVRDDEIQEARISGEAAVSEAEQQDGEASEGNGEHKKLQVLKLTDLKRMKITELTKMAHNLGIDGTQGLKKQELLVAILSNVTEKRYEEIGRAHV